MKSRVTNLVAFAMIAAVPALSMAQVTETAIAAHNGTTPVAAPEKTDTAKITGEKSSKSKFMSTAPDIDIQNVRPSDMRGINMFETSKDDSTPYKGFKISWGAAFTQQFQSLSHENTAAPKLVGTKDRNKLIDLGAGFNLAAANLYVNAQLADGIRVTLENYMSSRGHNEFWVKGGYLQVDKSPIDLPILNNIMKYTTLKIGHFENNYGDAHFRRTDNGQAMYNPFVGGYVLDAFTTEIGSEVYFRAGPWMAMGAISSGEVKGAVADPDKRSWAKYAKLGFDKSFAPKLRFRLTGSAYTTDKSMNQTLFSGDRAGSRYYEVLVDSVGRDRWSGSIQPGFRNEVTAFQVNPFLKIGGVELFGIIETAKGRAAAETSKRTINHYAGDLVYRFLDDRLYVGGRYNTFNGKLAGMTDEVSVKRTQFGGGWFVTPLVLLKGEYVNQKYNDFPTSDIRNGGKFNGFIAEGVVAF
jgi:hypothetical protein